MAVSAAECREMIGAARAADRKLMIGYRSRFQAHNRHAIDLVRRQAVGPARTIEAAHGFNIQPGQWRLDRALSGGGSLMDIGIYSLNAARYLTGEEPVAVTAMEATDRNDPRFATVEDRIDALFRFPSGALASTVSSYSSNHNAARVTGPWASSTWSRRRITRGTECASAWTGGRRRWSRRRCRSTSSSASSTTSPSAR